MNRNIRVAKDLIRLAKSLVAEESVADQEGKYKGFTGRIEWKGTSGSVENATFELVDDSLCLVKWHGGTWNDGYWLSGAWENGMWKDGWWYNGTWHKGTWENGNWIDGIWRNGEWKGGKDCRDNFHPEGDSPDKW